MPLTTKPVSVETASADREGVLVFSDDRLAAVLVRLFDESHEDRRGWWFLEAGFGRCSVQSPPVFSDLEKAQSWIEHQLATRIPQ